MATLNEHTPVLAAILSDISDHSDTNFIHILSANKCLQQIRKKDRKKEHFKTSKTPNEITICLQTHESRDQTCWIEVYYDYKKIRTLSREQIV